MARIAINPEARIPCRVCGSSFPATTSHYSGNGVKDGCIENECRTCRKARLKKYPSQNGPQFHARMKKNARNLIYSSAEMKSLALEKWRAQGGECFYCKKKLSELEVEGDHVIPIQRNGEHVEKNVVAACSPCNQEKGSKTLSEYREFLITRKILPKF